MTPPLINKTDMDVTPIVTPFFDEATSTFSYVVQDSRSDACAIVDCVMNLDYPSGTISFDGADQIIDHITTRELTVEWILETHVHADHLSAAPYIQGRLGGKIAIGVNISVIQETFGAVFNIGPEFQRDGSEFDVLLNDGDEIQLGTITGHALYTPGHTPACMTFLFGDSAFIGDTMFMPDGGTARADFPGGDAATLHRSIQKILTLPATMRVFICHDYCPDGRAVACQTTIAEQRQSNIHVNSAIDEATFVAMRQKRDVTLGMPTLILPSLQVNMRAGHLPVAEPSGQVFLKLPINAFGEDLSKGSQ